MGRGLHVCIRFLGLIFVNGSAGGYVTATTDEEWGAGVKERGVKVVMGGVGKDEETETETATEIRTEIETEIETEPEKRSRDQSDQFPWPTSQDSGPSAHKYQ